MTEIDYYKAARRAMVSEQIERRGITNPRLLEVLRTVPRHLFVAAEFEKKAYDDCPLPIGAGQTISQPFIVGLMTSLLTLQGDENVLEIGTGSGYQAAILAHLAKTVHTLERHEELAEYASRVLSDLGLDNVFVHPADGSLGWPEAAPYQAILVTAAAPRPPEPLLEQLALENGRLVIPVGSHPEQDLQVWRMKNGRLDWDSILPVSFVPMRGKFGWKEEEWQDRSDSPA
ncbi:MAG: protein-L-isoaspartate(D-aspartate) O-methyltransferase [Anaerolineaceae bacterium]|nr:protein-L-isoaspartate(D-aspartate) O-methyltransferase [Anaerolineaceae bacterium]